MTIDEAYRQTLAQLNEQLDSYEPKPAPKARRTVTNALSLSEAYRQTLASLRRKMIKGGDFE